MPRRNPSCRGCPKRSDGWKGDCSAPPGQSCRHNPYGVWSLRLMEADGNRPYRQTKHFAEISHEERVADMIKVRIELDEHSNLWNVKDTYINYDDQEVEQLGPIRQAVDYDEAIKEAKRWTMLKLRYRQRRETEEDVSWVVDPDRPLVPQP